MYSHVCVMVFMKIVFELVMRVFSDLLVYFFNVIINAFIF